MELKLNRIYQQPDGSFTRGYQGSNSGVRGTPSPVTTDTSWANFKSRYMVPSKMGLVPVDDGFKFGKATLLPGIKNAAKNGFKYLAGGIPGMVGSLVGTLVVNEMMNKGFQWMDDAQQYYKQQTLPDAYSNGEWPEAQAKCAAIGWKWWRFKPAGQTASFTCCISWNPYCDNGPIYYTSSLSTCPVGYTRSGGTCTAGTAPMTQAELDAAIQAAVDAKWPQIAQAAVDDGEVLEVPKNTQITVPTQEPMYPPPSVTTTTGTDQNGNPVTKVTTSQPKVTAKPGTTIADPIKTLVENTSTTETRTCDSAGANCTTKTETTSTSPSETPPNEDPCALNPEILGCLKVGTPPSSQLPTQTYNIPFNQVSFSLPTTCPASIPFNTHLGTYQFSFEYICQYAAGIRYLFLLVCSIGAYFIVAGSLQRKTA